jgi:hypothetical protein
MFSKAVLDGRFPASLLIRHRLVTRTGTKEEVQHFLEWYRSNGAEACRKSGLIFPYQP